MKKVILVVIGAMFLAYGGLLIWAGYSLRDPYGRGTLSDKAVPLTDPAVEKLRELLDKDANLENQLLVREYGFLPALGGAGILLVIFGLLVMRFSKRYFVSAYDKSGIKQFEVSLEKVRISDKDSPADINIDESLLDIPEDELADYKDINKMVALSHSALTVEQCERTLRVLYPGLLAYVGVMTEKALLELAKQVLDATIIRHKRQEKGITPDQFRLQNEHLNQTEQETICRRYMPKDVSQLPQEHWDKIGRVFVVPEQSKIQQELLSDTADWKDVSLNNAHVILSEASPAPPPTVSPASQEMPAPAPETPESK